MGNFLSELELNNSCIICKKFITDSDNFISCQFCHEMLGHKECIKETVDCPFCDFDSFL